LELLDDISGVMNIMGWKGCETVYYWRTVWLHLYPNTPVSPPRIGWYGLATVAVASYVHLPHHHYRRRACAGKAHEVVGGDSSPLARMEVRWIGGDLRPVEGIL
jgi:hypothetical protein